MANNYYNNYPNNNNKPKPKTVKPKPLQSGGNFTTDKDKEVLREIQLIYSLFPKGSSFRKIAEKKFNKITRSPEELIN
ncbi:MAG: hypothetical protein WCV91_06845 [Candidatus Margulisiibacteriota bacterium]|jgi:hypothetical protein